MAGWFDGQYTRVVYPYLTGPGARPGLGALHLVGEGGQFFAMDPIIFSINFPGVRVIGADAVIMPEADWSTVCQLASLAYTGK